MVTEVYNDNQKGVYMWYHYNRVCQGDTKISKYEGDDHCAHNMAKAFLLTHRHLETYISSNREDWIFKNVHLNNYPNQPWSKTPLKPIWHREVPVGGNTNTPSVSAIRLSLVGDDKIFKSGHTANYKQVIEFNSDPSKDVNLMSIDTGMSGNLFSGNYFTMNKPHLNGDLNKVITDFD